MARKKIFCFSIVTA